VKEGERLKAQGSRLKGGRRGLRNLGIKGLGDSGKSTEN
jgi:hypothetical protein